MSRRCVLLVLLPAALLAACTGEPEPAPSVSPTLPISTTGGLITRGTFEAYREGATAITYDPALVPPGSTAAVTIVPGPQVVIRLAVNGLVPRRAYGAHLHVRACGPNGDAAGPHYQQQPDPAASASPPSVDPAYANPTNEIWLDFMTDATGAGAATAIQPWTFDPARVPRALVIHAQTTKTGPGEAGMAGARLACLTTNA